MKTYFPFHNYVYKTTTATPVSTSTICKYFQIVLIHSKFENEYFVHTLNYCHVIILIDIATNNGPKKYIILSGIAAWDPSQLDYEIDQDGWDKKINSYLSIFDNDNEMWGRIINSKDI